MKSYKDMLKVLKAGYMMKAGYHGEVKEGTWHVAPLGKDRADLTKLMMKPIKLGKEGDDAVNAIEKYIGDDELFDDLYVAGKKNPNGDARPIIKKAMKRVGIKEGINEETILERIDRKLKERKNG